MPDASGGDVIVAVPPHDEADLGRLIVDAVRAGMAAISGLDADGVCVGRKSDRSPVTTADTAAEAAILDVLRRAVLIPVVAEEMFSRGDVPETGSRFFLVDPLDGTKSYIANRPDYTVNVALIEDGVPIFGCVGVPEDGRIYAGGRMTPASLLVDGETRPIACRAAGPRIDVLASRDHLSSRTQSYLDALPVEKRVSVGSSLKFCLLAEGGADLYPRFGRTMQWDTAAGDAVLRAAGGMTVGTDGEPLRYGRTVSPDDDPFANPDFLATGDRALLSRAAILPLDEG